MYVMILGCSVIEGEEKDTKAFIDELKRQGVKVCKTTNVNL
jgi:hypothetical protein